MTCRVPVASLLSPKNKMNIYYIYILFMMYDIRHIKVLEREVVNEDLAFFSSPRKSIYSSDIKKD